MREDGVCLGLSAGWNSYRFIPTQQTVQAQNEIVSVTSSSVSRPPPSATLSFSFNLFAHEQNLAKTWLGEFFFFFLSFLFIFLNSEPRLLSCFTFPLCLNTELKPSQ